MRKAIFTAPYLHYITLAAICQALAAFFFGFLTIAPVNAATNTTDTTNVNNFYFSDFTADYYLTPTTNGNKLKVVEKLTAEFPEANQNHGIERAIPFTNQGGANLTAPTISSLNFTATRGGQPEAITQANTKGDYYVFRLGDATSYVHGTQQYQLTYEFTNVVTDQSRIVTEQVECIRAPCPEQTSRLDFQELYWDTNGTGWSQRFDQLTANFHLDASLLGQLRYDTWCYVGRQGSNNQSRCTATRTDDGFTFTASNLAAHENLTFVVNFDADTFIVPPPRTNPTVLILFCISLGVFIVVLVLLCIGYRRHIRPGRKYYKHLFTPPQYTPHKGYTVADAATIYLGKTRRPQVATLLELATSHKIELIKGEPEGFLQKPSWQIRIIDDTDLTAAQRAMLEILQSSDQIAPGTTFKLTRQAYTPENQARAQIFNSSSTERFITDGLFRAKSARSRKLLVAIIAGTAINFGLWFAAFEIIANSSFHPYADLAYSMFLFFVINCILASFYTRLSRKYTVRTEKGLDLANYYQGLHDYIKLAEADRLKILQSVDGADTTPQGIIKLYEKLLPYAVLFGLERSWLAALGKYYDEHPDLTPDWCTGAAIGYLSVSDFDTFSSATSNSYSSGSAASDSGSGSGGGGSSGGGGGGGGGGGW